MGDILYYKDIIWDGLPTNTSPSCRDKSSDTSHFDRRENHIWMEWNGPNRENVTNSALCSIASTSRVPTRHLLGIFDYDGTEANIHWGWSTLDKFG